jgi:hypothetical protein
MQRPDSSTYIPPRLNTRVQYWCEDCGQFVWLDTHGYCSVCGSLSVSHAIPGRCRICGRGVDAGPLIANSYHRKCISAE